MNITINKTQWFSVFLKLWAFYELANALLSSVFIGEGAKLYGFSEWIKNPETIYIFTLYAVTLFALAVLYYTASSNPARYANIIWVLVAEQAIGAAFAVASLISGKNQLAPVLTGLGLQAALIGVAFFLKPEQTAVEEELSAGGLRRLKWARLFIGIWAGYELVNALLASVFLSQGASLYGVEGWVANEYTRYAFYQYAMGMFVLAAAYTLIATDVVRYGKLLTLFAAEQGATALTSVYLGSQQKLTTTQFALLLVFQLATVMLMIYLQPSRREMPPRIAETKP
ncbi:MAG: hypothetical protein IAF08_12570 [Rhizobacter sp.]|nr:hypothetical protein [Chlorobiales bacterium]